MKKLPFILMGILTFAILVAYINAKESKPTRVEFTEFLRGFVAQGTTIHYGLWTAIKNEAISDGNGQGDLDESPITFTIVSNRRFRIDEEKSFINGTWTFISSDGSSISGIFNGKGTNSNEFSGRFETTQSQKSTGTYSKAKISGEFTCWFIEPETYGEPWRYEAWWNGTFREGGA